MRFWEWKVSSIRYGSQKRRKRLPHQFIVQLISFCALISYFLSLRWGSNWTFVVHFISYLCTCVHSSWHQWSPHRPLTVFTHKGDLSKAWGESINQPRYFEYLPSLMTGTHTHTHTHTHICTDSHRDIFTETKHTNTQSWLHGWAHITVSSASGADKTGPQRRRWRQREAKWGQPPLN